MNSIDEIIDFVVTSDVIHEFPSTSSSKLKKLKKFQVSSYSLADSASVEPDQQPSITNTLSCSHESTSCVCKTFVTENKNTRGPSNRYYHQRMINKSKTLFVEFFKLFQHFGKSGQERILYQSCKRERYAFLELDSDNYMDDYTYHSTIKIIMDVIETNCPYCLESRFYKASHNSFVQFLTSDCGHSFCVSCFRHEKRVNYF